MTIVSLGGLCGPASECGKGVRKAVSVGRVYNRPAVFLKTLLYISTSLAVLTANGKTKSWYYRETSKIVQSASFSSSSLWGVYQVM